MNISRNSATIETVENSNWIFDIQDEMYKMFLNNELVDVFLTTAGGIRIGAHKNVLAASSKYFSQAFECTALNAEAQQSPLELQLIDIDGDVLKMMVIFCYTGGIELSFDIVPSVIKAANELKLHTVIDICCKFLIKHLSYENCCHIESIADQLQLTSLVNAANRFIFENFQRVYQSDAFLKLPIEKLASYLESDNINVSSEKEVFYALMHWTLYDSSSRLSHVPQLLSLIRLTQLEDTFLFDEVQNFAVGNNCSQFIIDALNWKLIPSRRHQINAKFQTVPRRKVSLVALAGNGSEIGNKCMVERYSVGENEWTPVISDLRFPIGCAIVELDGELIIIGGHMPQGSSSAKVFKISYSSGLMQSNMVALPDMLSPRSYHGAVVYMGCIYVGGGIIDRKSRMLSSMEVYDPAKQMWEYLSPMTKCRFEFNFAVAKGLLFAVGGVLGTNGQAYESFDLIECYDPANDEWSRIASMNRHHYAGAFAVLHDHLYVFGGIDTRLPLSIVTNSVECYNTYDNSWTMVAPMLSSRYGLRAVAMEDYILVVGGKGEYGDALQNVEKYDIKTNTWSRVANLTIPRSNHHLCKIKM